MKRPPRIAGALLFAALVLAASARERAAKPPYLGAIVEEAETGRVLFEDHADVVTPPASMTKLMTFAVLHDQLASGALTLQTPVTVTAADARIGGTQVWLKQGEVFPVEELIYAMMIQSANDAAHALAHAAAGTTEAFVALMNAKARELGMTHTIFRTPHGLPPADRRKADGDLSTPRDFATLGRYLLLETDVTKYTSVRARPFGQNRLQGAVMMYNHNHLLGKFTGLNGLKTGFTNGAGFCLTACATRNGRQIVAVVMGSPDWKTRDLKVAGLLENGFAALPPPLDLRTQVGADAAPVVAIPTVITGPAGGEPAAAPPPVTFRVIPPRKTP